jgi:hypothetical protein
VRQASAAITARIRVVARQALGRQQVGESDILFSGHYHTMRAQDLGGGRTWIMCPSMDNGSSFYRHKKGTDSMPGLVSVELTPAQAPHWRGLVLHTA